MVDMGAAITLLIKEVGRCPWADHEGEGGRVHLGAPMEQWSRL